MARTNRGNETVLLAGSCLSRKSERKSLVGGKLHKGETRTAFSFLLRSLPIFLLGAKRGGSPPPPPIEKRRRFVAP